MSVECGTLDEIFPYSVAKNVEAPKVDFDLSSDLYRHLGRVAIAGKRLDTNDRDSRIHKLDWDTVREGFGRTTSQVRLQQYGHHLW